jgi:cystathionine beta-lyase family protein involved in aluminum resistance
MVKCISCGVREATCGLVGKEEYCDECSYLFQAIPGLSSEEQATRFKVRRALLAQMDLSKVK